MSARSAGGKRVERGRLKNALREIVAMVSDSQLTDGETLDEIRLLALAALGNWTPRKPDEIMEAILAAPPAGPETLRRLARLQELYAAGAMTSDHYQKRRREIPTEGWDDPPTPRPAPDPTMPPSTGTCDSTGRLPSRFDLSDADDGHSFLCRCKRCD